MSNRKDGFGFITFECDDCGDEFEADCTDFKLAVSKLKSDGWWFEKVITKQGRSTWRHYCSRCKANHAQPFYRY
jgi:hypothetical protein